MCARDSINLAVFQVIDHFGDGLVSCCADITLERGRARDIDKRERANGGEREIEKETQGRWEERIQQVSYNTTTHTKTHTYNQEVLIQ